MFTIRLLQYKNYDIHFTRDKFLSHFPNSLISNTLEMTSDTVIELNKSFITPTTLDILHHINEAWTIPNYEEEPNIRDNLCMTGDYMNIDLLVLIGHERYPVFIEQFPKYDILDLKSIPEDQLQVMLNHSITYKYIPMINYLLDSEMDPTYGRNFPIRLALFYDLKDIVTRLIKDVRVDPSVEGNYVFRRACELGYDDIADSILAKVDPSNMTLVYASIVGQIKVVKRLLKDSRINPASMNHMAIKCTSAHGHLEIVKLLLPYSNIKSATGALRRAKASGKKDVVE